VDDVGHAEIIAPGGGAARVDDDEQQRRDEHSLACQQPSILYPTVMKVTFDIDPDLYRSLKVEAARADRSLRDVVSEAIAGWLERTEEEEDRGSAAEALEEYRRDGGTAAAAFFEHLAAEAREAYGPGD
jgi:hypothetical protein